MYTLLTPSTHSQSTERLRPRPRQSEGHDVHCLLLFSLLTQLVHRNNVQKEVRDVQLAISRQVNVRGSLYRLIKLNVTQESSIGLVDLDSVVLAVSDKHVTLLVRGHSGGLPELSVIATVPSELKQDLSPII